jgi:hypothetical protein
MPVRSVRGSCEITLNVRQKGVAALCADAQFGRATAPLTIATATIDTSLILSIDLSPF